MPKLPIYGLCRFSYPTQAGSGFQRGADIALYSEERLAKRMALFEEFCAPSIAVQSDPDFTFMVLVGEGLPQKWQKRLSEVAEAVPQMQLRYEPEGQHHRDICVKLMLEMRDPAAPLCAEFRLDDDDAIAFDYIERIRASRSDIAGLITQSPAVEINFVNSLWLALDGHTLRGYLEPMRHLTSAQAFYFKTKHDRTMFNFAHHRAWHYMPTVTIPGRVMSLRSLHAENDSLYLTREVDRQDWLERQEIEQILEARFGFDLAQIEQNLTPIFK